MSSETGFSLDERIRQSLQPLGGPLRIDAFVILMARERAQRAARAAQKGHSGGWTAPPPAAEAAPPARDASPGAEDRPEAGSPDEAPPLSDSARLRAEVSAFIRRDDVGDASTSEVREFLDFMGGSALVPEEQPEE